MTHETGRGRFPSRFAQIAAIVAVASALAGSTVLPGSHASSAGAAAHAPRDEAPSWRAGVAKTIVTPEKAVWLAGYGSKRVPDGKLHNLWAKSLALEDQKGRRAVLITSDFQGVPRGMSDSVFERLRTWFGLARHQVMFTFSHNHCGPRLGDDLADYYPV